MGGKRIGRDLPEEKGSKAKMIRKLYNLNYIFMLIILILSVVK